MRRLLAPALLCALGVLAACGSGSDDVAETDEPVVVDEVDQAVDVARMSLPAALGDSAIEGLVEGLCAGDAQAVSSELQGAGLDAAQQAQALAALADGARTLCDDVDAVVPEVQQALAPTTTAPAANAATASGGSTGSSSAASSGTTGASSSSSGSGGTSNQSSGTAAVGGGDATGTGNSSSTGMSQQVGGSSSSNSASSSNG